MIIETPCDSCLINGSWGFLTRGHLNDDLCSVSDGGPGRRVGHELKYVQISMDLARELETGITCKIVIPNA
jgi:hypothetical protein